MSSIIVEPKTHVHQSIRPAGTSAFEEMHHSNDAIPRDTRQRDSFVERLSNTDMPIPFDESVWEIKGYLSLKGYTEKVRSVLKDRIAGGGQANLWLSAFNNDIEICSLAHAQGIYMGSQWQDVPPHTGPVSAAPCYEGHVHVLDILLQNWKDFGKGKDPGAKCPLWMIREYESVKRHRSLPSLFVYFFQCSHDHPGLHVAASSVNATAAVLWLLEKRYSGEVELDIWAKSKAGQTALDVAVQARARISAEFVAFVMILDICQLDFGRQVQLFGVLCDKGFSPQLLMEILLSQKVLRLERFLQVRQLLHRGKFSEPFTDAVSNAISKMLSLCRTDLDLIAILAVETQRSSISCIKLAMEANLADFVAHPLVQQVLARSFMSLPQMNMYEAADFSMFASLFVQQMVAVGAFCVPWVVLWPLSAFSQVALSATNGLIFGMAHEPYMRFQFHRFAFLGYLAAVSVLATTDQLSVSSSPPLGYIFVVLSFNILLHEGHQLYQHGKMYLFEIRNAFEVIASITMIVGILQNNRHCIATSVLFSWLQVFNFFAQFKNSSVLLRIVVNVCTKDLVVFMPLIVVLWVAMAFTHNIAEGRHFWNTMYYFTGAFINGDIVENPTFDTTEFPSFYAGTMIVFFGFVNILMLNLLIAMMNTSYEDAEARALINHKFSMAVRCLDSYAYSYLPPMFYSLEFVAACTCRALGRQCFIGVKPHPLSSIKANEPVATFEWERPHKPNQAKFKVHKIITDKVRSELADEYAIETNS